MSLPKLSYSIEEAGEATSLSRNTLYRAIAANEIRTFKIGRRRMVSELALREFIAKKEREATAAGVAA